MSPGGSARLDAALAERGLARSRTQAARLIADGRVTVDGRTVTRASTVVTVEAVLLVSEPDRYVSRAALKLAAALERWPVETAGRLVLDCGASTGGFTQVLLERDARRVIALDVGHGQLVPEVRDDPRVLALEGVNARYLDAATLADLTGSDERPSLVVADVSFISLTAILPALRAVSTPGADAIVLVKPQFEVGRRAVRRGVVVSASEHARAIENVLAAAAELDWHLGGALSSPILGEAGNREFLVWLRAAVAVDPTEWEGVVRRLTEEETR